MPTHRTSGRPAQPKLKSALRQAYERVQAEVRLGFTPGEYELYRLHEVGKRLEDGLEFAPDKAWREVVRPKVNDPAWQALLDNKWVFGAYYRQHGVPLPRHLGLFDPVAGVAADGSPLRTEADLHALLKALRPPSLVAKPVLGWKGARVLIFPTVEFDGPDIRLVASDGSSIGVPELAAAMRVGERGVDAFVLQERVVQHPDVAALNADTTNTVRVVTLREPDGSVAILRCALRVGRPGAVVDSWRHGAVAMQVDIGTGELGVGQTLPLDGGLLTRHHPVTGVPLTGRRLPGWDGLLAACRHAATVTPGLHSIGWDVALGVDGPVIIEGNSGWGVPLVQVQRGLLDAANRERLRAYGVEFPTSLPPVTPALVGKAARQVLDRWRHGRDF